MSHTTLPEAVELEYQRIRDILAQSAIILQQQAANREVIQQASADTDCKFKETDRKLARLENLFETQWGRLMESLVDGDLVPMLRQRGILVTDTTCRLKGQRADGGNFEFDIVAHNGLADNHCQGRHHAAKPGFVQYTRNRKLRFDTQPVRFFSTHLVTNRPQ